MHRALPLNTIIGEYRIVDFVGMGGMGEVYRAMHNKIGRLAAVKVLTNASNTDGLLDRFFNEARIQASLHHPNIATLYDFIELEGQPCIIMEYVDGHTLAERVRPCGPLALAETVYIFQAVVEAIAYIHSHGVVHRDIKSNNIKISSDGQVKLLDFGIAKAEASPGLTATGSVIGTLEYISPEQLMGGVADARSDIWALGVLLYEMVTGRVPFEALTLGELCKKIEKVDYPPAAVLNPHVPREVTAIITRCLRKNPIDRYRLAQDLLEDTRRLRSLVSTPGLTAHARGGGGGAAHSHASSLPNLNWKVVAGVAGGAMLLLVLVVGVYFAATSLSTPTTGANLAPASEGTARELAATPEAPANDKPDGVQTKTITIDAFGGKADVYQKGDKVCETPCPLNVRLGEDVTVMLRRANSEDTSETFTVGAQTGTITIRLKDKQTASDEPTGASNY